MASTTYFTLIIALIVSSAACSLWVPLVLDNQTSSSAVAFTKLLVPTDIADFLYPVTGKYVHYLPSYNTPYSDLCASADKIAQDCVHYFCDSSIPPLLNSLKNRTFHAMMHNYCNYCVTSKRNVTLFHLFHTVKQNCTKFISFSEWNCGEGNFPYMLDLMLNVTLPTPPFICYCDSAEKFGAICDGWITFWFTFSFVGARIFFLIYGVSLVTLSMILCVFPQYGIKIRNCVKSKQKIHWAKFFDIRLQSLVICVLTIILEILEQVNGLIYYSKNGAPLRKIAGGLFRTLSVFSMMLGYAFMVVMWYAVSDK